jgi:hypothetical protein
MVITNRSRTGLSRRLAHLGTAVIAAAALAGGMPAGACYSGLVLIPTADVVESGNFSLEAQFDGAFAHGHGDARILNTELGLTPRFEAGVDRDFTKDADTREFLNAKYVSLAPGKRHPAVAVGICNVGHNMKSNPYAVATTDFHAARGHFGVVSTDGNGRWFVGADSPVNKKLTLMADYTSGDENSSSIGFSYQISDRFGITSGVVFPNAGGDTEFTVHFVFCGPCRHTGKRG